MYSEDRKTLAVNARVFNYHRRNKMKAGYEWDLVNRRWKPVNYLDMTDEQLQERRDQADDRLEEISCQVKTFIPVAKAQKLLNMSADELMDLLVKLAKKTPEALIKVI